MVQKTMKRVALVTGANRGIGFEVSKQLGKLGHAVIVGARSESAAQTTVQKLTDYGVQATGVVLDVALDASCDSAVQQITQKFGRLDILVNNAGIMNDEGSIFNASIEKIRTAMETNTFGALRLSQRLIPLMLKNGYGRIVNVSSGMGQLSEMNGAYTAYRLSKLALNGVTKILAEELQGKNILVNSVCPGWVKTDMGGPGAELPVEEGADTLVWAATLPDSGPSGGFFRERESLPW